MWEAGFGSLYWMEGVVVRLQDRRGGTGEILNVLRVNNDNFCDLAALTVFNDRCWGQSDSSWHASVSSRGSSKIYVPAKVSVRVNSEA